MPVYELILSSDTINEGRIKINNAFSATTGLWSGSTGVQSLIHNNDSGNIAEGDYSIVAGYNNIAEGDSSFVVGSGNTVSASTSEASVIIGGYDNFLHTSVKSSIFGGTSNTLLSGFDSSILGGSGNTLAGYRSSIIGGVNNQALNITPYACVGMFAGKDNEILGFFGTSDYSTIVGGLRNFVQNSDKAFIAGGQDNTVTNGGGSGADSSSIIGGQNQTIDNSSNSFIGGGFNGTIEDASYSFIGGGYNNTIKYPNCLHTFIGGGINNIISGSSNSVIVGGSDNEISSTGFAGAELNSIVGGQQNIIDTGYFCSIISSTSSFMRVNFASVIIGGGVNTIQTSQGVGIICSDSSVSNGSVDSVILGGKGLELDGSDFSAMFGGGAKTTTYGANKDFVVVMGGTDTTIPTTTNNTIAFDMKAGNGYWDGAADVGPADYAEYFEWNDGNLLNEDRVGYFVSLVGEKIEIGNSDIIGIVSSTPAMAADAAPLKWKDTYLRDEFGRKIQEKYEIYVLNKNTSAETRIYIDERKNIYKEVPSPGNILGVLYNGDSSSKEYAKDYYSMKLNPLYDPNENYTPRKDRPEWSPIGLLGKLYVRTSEAITGNKISVDANGMAINGTDYHVLKETKAYDGNYGIVQILFK